MAVEQEFFMGEALALAREAALAGEVPVGCVRPLPRPTGLWVRGGWRAVSCMSRWNPALCAPERF